MLFLTDGCCVVCYLWFTLAILTCCLRFRYCLLRVGFVVISCVFVGVLGCLCGSADGASCGCNWCVGFAYLLSFAFFDGLLCCWICYYGGFI